MKHMGDALQLSGKPELVRPELDKLELGNAQMGKPAISEMSNKLRKEKLKAKSPLLA